MVKVSKSDDRVSPTLRTVNKIAIIVPHQKSAGFSWGAAGVSTCRWKVHLFFFSSVSFVLYICLMLRWVLIRGFLSVIYSSLAESRNRQRP